MKILLVDDEVEFVSALGERLALREFEADWTTRPEEAIELVQKKCYDIAVLDIKMPRVSGFALKKELETRCPEMKFIFLTGHGSEEAFKAGINETGSDYYLVKPVRFEDLLKKIRSAASETPGGEDDD
ncbi:MAG: response regulator [Desulfobacterales bacterium]|jgi:DNA-binding response OmpR family regulator